MIKDIKPYLPFYLGCEVICIGKKAGTKHYRLHGITNDGTYSFRTIPENFSIALQTSWKLVLRNLSDMSEEEAIELAKLSEWEPHFRDVKVTRNKITNDIIITWDGMAETREEFNATGELFYCSEQFQWLLSKHFDLFGLIESGLAIDKTKL